MPHTLFSDAVTFASLHQPFGKKSFFNLADKLHDESTFPSLLLFVFTVQTAQVHFKSPVDKISAQALMADADIFLQSGSPFHTKANSTDFSSLPEWKNIQNS